MSCFWSVANVPESFPRDVKPTSSTVELEPLGNSMSESSFNQSGILPDQERQYRLRWENRTERFAKLVKLNAPSYVLMCDLLLLLDAAKGLFPDHYYLALRHHEEAFIRLRAGLCPHCGRDLHNSNPRVLDLCVQCEADAKALDDCGDDR